MLFEACSSMLTSDILSQSEERQFSKESRVVFDAENSVSEQSIIANLANEISGCGKLQNELFDVNRSELNNSHSPSSNTTKMIHNSENSGLIFKPEKKENVKADINSKWLSDSRDEIMIVDNEFEHESQKSYGAPLKNDIENDQKVANEKHYSTFNNSEEDIPASLFPSRSKLNWVLDDDEKKNEIEKEFKKQFRETASFELKNFKQEEQENVYEGRDYNPFHATISSENKNMFRPSGEFGLQKTEQWHDLQKYNKQFTFNKLDDNDVSKPESHQKIPSLGSTYGRVDFKINEAGLRYQSEDTTSQQQNNAQGLYNSNIKLTPAKTKMSVLEHHINIESQMKVVQNSGADKDKPFFTTTDKNFRVSLRGENHNDITAGEVHFFNRALDLSGIQKIGESDLDGLETDRSFISKVNGVFGGNLKTVESRNITATKQNLADSQRRINLEAADDGKEERYSIRVENLKQEKEEKDNRSINVSKFKDSGSKQIAVGRAQDILDKMKLKYETHMKMTTIEKDLGDRSESQSTLLSKGKDHQPEKGEPHDTKPNQSLIKRQNYTPYYIPKAYRLNDEYNRVYKKEDNENEDTFIQVEGERSTINESEFRTSIRFSESEEIGNSSPHEKSTQISTARIIDQESGASTIEIMTIRGASARPSVEGIQKISFPSRNQEEKLIRERNLTQTLSNCHNTKGASPTVTTLHLPLTKHLNESSTLTQRNSGNMLPAEDILPSTYRSCNLELKPHGLRPVRFLSKYVNDPSSQENNSPREVPIAPSKSHQQRSTAATPRKAGFGYAVKEDAFFRTADEKRLNMDIFCMNCEEFIEIDQVDSHSNYCVKKTERVLQSENYQRKETPQWKNSTELQIEEHNEEIELIIVKINNALKTIGHFSDGTGFRDCCKKLVKVARDIVSDDSNFNFIKQKMQEFDQIFASFSDCGRGVEIAVRIYLLRLFAALQRKTETLKALVYNESHRIAQLQEQQLEMWRYQSKTLQDIQELDAKATWYLRNSIKNEMEVLSEIQSDIASPVHQSSATAGTTESEQEFVQAKLFSTDSQINRESLKRYFYTEAANIKLALSTDHPGQEYLISELYEECMEMQLPKEEYTAFLIQKLNQPK